MAGEMHNQADVALADDRTVLDWPALDEAVRRGTNRLLAEALPPGSRVAIFMENRIEVFETMFACWLAGLCVVPINAKLHPREVAYIVGDCAASAVFTTGANVDPLREQLPPRAAELIAVDSDAYTALTRSEPSSCVDVAATDPAWVFYTRGTTGQPKGAVLSHRLPDALV